MNALAQIRTATRTSHFVETRIGKLHVVEAGLGQDTLVLWPSIFSDHHIYDHLVTQLGGQYRFLLVDGPAHGQSGGPSTEFSMQDCADALDTVLDNFGVEQAVVGGTSWGGMVAAHLALARPKRVKALILMNTPMTIDGAHPGLKSRLIASGARWMLRSAMFRNGVANSFFSTTALSQNGTYATAFHAMLKTANPKRLATAIRSVILRGSPLMDMLADITVPTLVLAGKDDAMYPLSTQANAALRLPKGRFVAVDGKHISVVEQPEAVADALTEFLDREAFQ